MRCSFTAPTPGCVVAGLFDDENAAQRESDYVEHLLAQAEEFAIFLGACRGCYVG